MNKDEKQVFTHVNMFTEEKIVVTGSELLPFGEIVEEFTNYERENDQFTWDDDKMGKNYIGKKFRIPSRIFKQLYDKI